MKISRGLFLPLRFARKELILLASLGFISCSIQSSLQGDNSNITSKFSVYHYALSSNSSLPDEEGFIRTGWNLSNNGKIRIAKFYSSDTRHILVSSHGNSSSEWDGVLFLNEWKKSIREIVDKIPGLQSIQLDFEGYRERDALAFHRLMCNTYHILQKEFPQIQLNLAYFPPTHPDNRGFHDWNFKSRCFQKIFIMMYDYHNPRTKPGNVTDSDWIRKNLDTIHRIAPDIARSDLIIGLPLYGYIWDKNGRFERHITLKESDIWNSNGRMAELKKKRGNLYPHNRDFNRYWEKESKSLGYGGVVYWRWGFGG